MKQEDKELLLKDLCARLPYGLKCDRLGNIERLISVKPEKVFCITLDNGEYILDSGSELDENVIYYNRSYDNDLKEYVYTNAHAVVGLPIFNEVKDNLYIKINNEYASCSNEPEFNDSATYYQLNNYTDE